MKRRAFSLDFKAFFFKCFFKFFHLFNAIDFPQSDRIFFPDAGEKFFHKKIFAAIGGVFADQNNSGAKTG